MVEAMFWRYFAVPIIRHLQNLRVALFVESRFGYFANNRWCKLSRPFILTLFYLIIRPVAFNAKIRPRDFIVCTARSHPYALEHTGTKETL